MLALCRQGGVQFAVRHTRRGSEECRERRFPWRRHLAVADHRAAEVPDREPVDHRPIILRFVPELGRERQLTGVDISLAGGWIEVACIVRPAGEVVISMRPVSVFANGPGSGIEQLEAELRGRWRQATRAVMVLLSLHGLPPAQIAALLDCHPATVRR